MEDDNGPQSLDELIARYPNINWLDGLDGRNGPTDTVFSDCAKPANADHDSGPSGIEHGGTSLDPFINFFEDSKIITDSINERRLHSQQQIALTEKRYNMCNSVKKTKTDQITRRMENLKESDKLLYDYVSKLEVFNCGVWCANCDIGKNVEYETWDQLPIPDSVSEYRKMMLRRREHSHILDTKFRKLLQDYDDLQRNFEEMVDKVKTVMCGVSETIKKARECNRLLDAPYETVVTRASTDQNSDSEFDLLINRLNCDSEFDLLIKKTNYTTMPRGY